MVFNISTYAANDDLIASYILASGDHKNVVRVVTKSSTCPSIDVNHKLTPMTPRVGPLDGTLTQDKPALFPELVCELQLPPNSNHVLLDERLLPTLKDNPKKIVIIGDTGCRLKAPKEFQSCSDPALWPLAKVANSAALEKADLVIHVGDYHYRESKCNLPGCENSPFGYGFDTWNLDFFIPMQPLLASSPWVFVRGNHESCARAGQGWFRFLDPLPFNLDKSCLIKDQEAANYAEPYTVSLDSNTQLIVFDSSGASEKPINPEDTSSLAIYKNQFKSVEKLAKNKSNNWLLLHHPVLGYGYSSDNGFMRGNATLIAALEQSKFTNFFPNNIQLTIQGHIHTFELNSFKGSQPLSLLAGFGGSLLEPEFTKPLPPDFKFAKEVEMAESLSAQNYGYSVMEKINDSWILKQKDIDGKLARICRLELSKTPRIFDCEKVN